MALFFLSECWDSTKPLCINHQKQEVQKIKRKRTCFIKPNNNSKIVVIKKVVPFWVRKNYVFKCFLLKSSNPSSVSWLFDQVRHDLIEMGFLFFDHIAAFCCTSSPDDLVPIIKNIIIWYIWVENLLILKQILAVWMEINHDIRIHFRFSYIDLVPKIN